MIKFDKIFVIIKINEVFLMKQICIIIMLLALITVSTTACTRSKKAKQNMIQSKRRFAEYIEPQKSQTYNRIDLSDGQKLRYDAKLGPQNLNFDIKIVDPY